MRFAGQDDLMGCGEQEERVNDKITYKRVTSLMIEIERTTLGRPIDDG
jgi:hypothetical protein